MEAVSEQRTMSCGRGDDAPVGRREHSGHRRPKKPRYAYSRKESQHSAANSKATTAAKSAIRFENQKNMLTD